MAEITSITPQLKDKERCNIYVDGRFYCGLRLETAVRCRLRVGQHIELSQLDEIQLESEKSQALDKALKHLSASMKTEKQMRDYLAKKGYVPAVCDHVLEKLRGYGFVDDAEYARGKGARLIALELKQKGVGEEAVEAALSELPPAANAAEAVLQKYMRHKPPTRENLAKAYRHLLSRGFGYDEAKEAVAALRGGAEEDGAEEGEVESGEGEGGE